VPVEVASALPGVQIVDVQPDKIRVRIEPAVTTNLNVSAKFEGQLAPGYEILETKIDPDKVEVKGAQNVINSLVNATAVVKLAGEDRDIKRKVDLEAFDQFDKPIRGVVFGPEKAEVTVSVTRQGGGKVVGIKPDISGKPALGYWINKIDYDPSNLRVVGSEDILKNIDYIATQKVDISDLKSTKDFDVGFALPEGVSLEAGQPEKIKITVGIASNSVSRQIIPGFSFTNLGNGLKVTQIDPTNVQVVVTGPPNLLNNLSTDNVVANIDLAGKGTGSYVIGLNPGKISKPAGVDVSSIVPSNVTITIEGVQ
jgi:YbbR domain-containing protein